MAFETFDLTKSGNDGENVDEIALQLLIKELNDDLNENTTVHQLDNAKLLQLAESLYGHGIKSNNLLTGGDMDDESELSGEDDDQEESDQEEEVDSGEESEERDELEQTTVKMDPKFFQFGHEEEEELKDDDDDDESSDEDEITQFDDFLKGNLFENSLRILDIVKDSVPDDKLRLSKIYDLMGNNLLELESFEDSVKAYKKSIKHLDSHHRVGKDYANEEITDAHLRLCEALKWAQDTGAYKKQLQITIRLFAERIDKRKSKDKEIDETTLEELKEDLEDTDEANQDIRTKHPAFDNILKRALGQLLNPDELALEAGDVNDLSSMIKKKKPKKH